MGAVTSSLGGGLNDSTDQTVTLSTNEEMWSNVVLTNTSTYISGGFDSLGNAYTTRPIAITDISILVARSQSANVGIRPQFKSGVNINQGTPLFNSSVTLFTGSLAADTTLSTESLYIYKTFTTEQSHYGFKAVELSGAVEYGHGGSVGQVFKGLTGTISSNRKLSGSITQVSIPGPVRTPNALSITDTTANIIWSAPADDGMQSPASYSASNIKGYRINYRNSGAENWKVLVANTGSNSTSRIVTGLSPSTYYEIQVAALNAVTDAHNSSYANITAHVGERSITYPFTTAVSTNDARIWTGAEFKKSIIKIWNGTAWIQYPNVRAKVWDGTVFKDLALDS
jgi:hypothetical protein